MANPQDKVTLDGKTYRVVAGRGGWPIQSKTVASTRSCTGKQVIFEVESVAGQSVIGNTYRLVLLVPRQNTAPGWETGDGLLSDLQTTYAKSGDVSFTDLENSTINVYFKRMGKPVEVNPMAEYFEVPVTLEKKET